MKIIPDDLSFFEPDGVRFRSLSSPSGGISTRSVAYLIDVFPSSGYDLGINGLHEENGGRWYAIECDHTDTPASIESKVREAVRALRPNGVKP